MTIAIAAENQASSRTGSHALTSVSRILTPTTEVFTSLQAIEVGGLVSSNSGIIPVSGQTWQYSDATTFNREGLYCIWVEAEDEADNQQTSAAYALQVTIGQVTSGDLANISIRQSDNNGQYRLFLPLIGVSYNNDSTNVYRYFVDPALCR